MFQSARRLFAHLVSSLKNKSMKLVERWVRAKPHHVKPNTRTVFTCPQNVVTIERLNEVVETDELSWLRSCEFNKKSVQ